MLKIKTDGESLLFAILSDRSDDAPRLAYADWLEEQGEPERAAFVRSPATITGDGKFLLPTGEGMRDQIRLFHAATTNEARWLGVPLRTRAQVEADRRDKPGGAGCCNRYADMQACDCLDRAARVTWSRGFVSAVELSTVDFLAHAGDLFARHPVEVVRLSDRRPYRTVSDQFGWSADDEDRHHMAWLPDQLWERLEPNGRRRNYLFFEEAVQELSHACVRYGRVAAGLEAQ